MADVQSSLVAQGSGSMAKALSIAGMIVAGLFVLIFGADLILKVPFGRKEMVADIGFLTSALILAYLSWNAFRDSR